VSEKILKKIQLDDASFLFGDLHISNYGNRRARIETAGGKENLEKIAGVRIKKTCSIQQEFKKW